eukprot:CAMPEP_0172308806 /NCGR_PEP_ID=MMETSP1058-20130122/9291_1 /TAXON_ID=83371 /ORGANISM="Detonula confervacea, Strain CCMP 353" /LENGTH=1533 /DNA_ID=CAMNT_0013021311 /DNA_START=117 /DNA_END=4718 /DNA_ORIENTATION=+
MAWIGPRTTRSLFATRTTLPNNGRYSASAVSSTTSSSCNNYNRRPQLRLQSNTNSNNHNNNNNNNNSNNVELLLESKLRQLALLNGGKSINPRSPRQVSNLLYNNGKKLDYSNFQSRTSSSSSSSNGENKNNVLLGPTDKATLQRIIVGDAFSSSDDAADDNSSGGDVVDTQKEVATLILQCRELLASSSSTKNNVGRTTSSESFAAKASRRGVIEHENKKKQSSLGPVANFSNAASSSTLDSDAVIRGLENNGNGNDVQEEDIAPLITNRNGNGNDGDTIITSALPSFSSASSAAAYSSMSPYEQMVRDLFPPNIDNNVANANDEDNDNPNNNPQHDGTTAEETMITLDRYWLDPLLSLTKSSSRSLVRQLQSSHCPMGYDPSAKPLKNFGITSKNNTTTTNTTTTMSTSTNKADPKQRTTGLLSYIRQQKLDFNDSVILLRVGDFYETYGLDAILLVEHAGLNPMANKCKAGCPWRNVQSTLDALTRVGFRVAVYEEWKGGGAVPGGSRSSDERDDGTKKKSTLKTRYLAQVVSSANPTYMYGLVLNDDGSASDDTPSPGNSDISSSSPGRSYVGVIETAAGYTLVEVSAEERTVVVSERLTSDAVSCRLVAYPPADPLFYVPPYTEDTGVVGRSQRLNSLPFLPWRQQSSSALASQHTNGYSQGNYGIMVGNKVRVKTLPPSLVVSPKHGLTDIERAKQTVVSAFLRLEDDHRGLSEEEEDSATRRAVTHDDFMIVASSSSGSSSSHSVSPDEITTSHPLHLETATQLGLMSDPAIPPLLSSLLPHSAPSSSRRFLRRWLLIPPPPDIANAMSNLVRTLKDEDDRALPSFHNVPPLTGKVISLIRARQASAVVYREILSALDAASEVLLLDGGEDVDTISQDDESSGIVDPLMKILQHDTGTMASNSMSLRASFIGAMKIIESVVSTQNLEHSLRNIVNCDDDSEQRDYISYYGDVVPPAFFERNEAIWRGRVKPNALEHAHIVPLAAKRLAEAIAADFWGVHDITYEDDDDGGGVIDLSGARESKNPIYQDVFNNQIAIKSIPTWAEESKDEDETESDAKKYYHPRDRNGKVLRARYTTERVQEAISEYVEACASARLEVENVLTQLSLDLVDGGHLPAILQASHLNLILSTAAHHAASSNAKGWSVATTYDNDDSVNKASSSSAGYFNGVWPYWMDGSESVSNTFDLNGLFLLTAPNMSGKSTLMRSTAAAALLINTGLCAPVSPGSTLRRFDSIFVRGASADVPTEDKSAFGAEMGDVAALLRSCGGQSLVFVDEIGRGTSPKDGTSLAGAILERMSESGMSGMFATHLHGILKLPYSSAAEERLREKRMAITEDDRGQLKWTYTLEDGVCTNSLALVTAAKFGLSDTIIKRAEEFSAHWEANTGDHKESSVGLTNHASSTNTIHHVISILEETVGKGSSTQIPPSYMSPPSLEGTSCVYILLLGDEGSSKMRYYVGETDSLSRRLSQHRSKGKDWSTLSAIAIKIEEGKSNARNVESLVIQRMAKSGYNLVSITDGTSIRSRGRTG